MKHEMLFVLHFLVGYVALEILCHPEIQRCVEEMHLQLEGLLGYESNGLAS